MFVPYNHWRVLIVLAMVFILLWMVEKIGMAWILSSSRHIQKTWDSFKDAKLKKVEPGGDRQHIQQRKSRLPVPTTLPIINSKFWIHEPGIWNKLEQQIILRLRLKHGKNKINSLDQISNQLAWTYSKVSYDCMKLFCNILSLIDLK